MLSHVHRDDSLFLENEFDGDPVGDIYADGMQVGESSSEPVQPEGRMVRVDFQEPERLFVLGDEFRVSLYEPAGSLVIAFSVEDPVGHSAAFEMRLM